MTKQPWTISRTASLADAHRMMREHDIRHLPVLDNGELVGVVTQRDLHLLETIADFPLDSVDVEEAMTQHPFSVTGDTALDDVVELMAEKKYGSAIIVGRNGVEGIFTAVDACHVLAELLRKTAGMPSGDLDVRHTGYSR